MQKVIHVSGNVWISSDHHFCHKNILQYDNRPYTSIEDHDNALVDAWNKLVKPEDSVIYLGDFLLGSKDQFSNIYSNLNGHILFIAGNHDQLLLKLYKQSKINNFVYLNPEDYLILNLEGFGNIFSMSHYPLTSTGYRHLHGHTHSTDVIGNNGSCLNVSVTAHNWEPVSLMDLLECKWS